MANQELVSVKLARPWNVYNAGEIVGVPLEAAEKMEKLKVAKRVEAPKTEPQPQPRLRLKDGKPKMVRVKALKPFDLYMTGEIAMVPDGEGVERLVERGVIELVQDEPEAKMVSAPAMNKAMSPPKAK